jgi:hypothetical protein
MNHLEDVPEYMTAYGPPQGAQLSFMAPAFTITDQHETETISPTVKVVPVLE